MWERWNELVLLPRDGKPNIISIDSLASLTYQKRLKQKLKLKFCIPASAVSWQKDVRYVAYYDLEN